MDSPVFELGNTRVRFENMPAPVLEALLTFLPVAQDCTSEQPIVLSERVSDADEALMMLVGEIVGLYEDNLLLDAALLRTPEDRVVLLAGASGAGKSTLSIALLKYGWQLVCEDNTFVLAPSLIMPALSLPTTLRPGTTEKLKAQLGFEPPLFAGRWFFNAEAYSTAAVKSAPDLIVLLHAIEHPDQPKAVSLEPASVDDMLKALLACSNALRRVEGVDTLHALVCRSPGWFLHGGTIKERVEALQALVANT